MNKIELDFTSIEECQICAFVPKIIQPPLIVRDWSITNCCNQLICKTCSEKTEFSCPFCRHTTLDKSIEIIRVRISSDCLEEFLNLLFL